MSERRELRGRNTAMRGLREPDLWALRHTTDAVEVISPAFIAVMPPGYRERPKRWRRLPSAPVTRAAHGPAAPPDVP
jgi:hypothetical protein